MANFKDFLKKHCLVIVISIITFGICLMCFFGFSASIREAVVSERCEALTSCVLAVMESAEDAKDGVGAEIYSGMLDNAFYGGEKEEIVVINRSGVSGERGDVLASNTDMIPVGSNLGDFLKELDAYDSYLEISKEDDGYILDKLRIQGEDYYIIYTYNQKDASVILFLPDHMVNKIAGVYQVGCICLMVVLVAFVFAFLSISLRKQKKLSDSLSAALQSMKDKDARMDLLSYLMNEFTFEYDIKEDCLKFTDKYQRIFQRGKNFLRFRETIRSHYTIYHLDADNILNALDEIMKGREEGNALFRLQMSGGNYEWFNAYYKVMYDDSHVPKFVVGKMLNVHQSQTEKEMLLTKSTRDPLTSLLNRAEMEKRTTTYIEDMDSEDMAALLIMDLDHFKQVNDTFGHSRGDDLLRDVAAVIRDSFRTNDIIGRLGGDEFFVFMKDIASGKDAVNKCEKVRLALQKDVSYESSTVSISASMGIVFVKQGMNFLDIYMKADSALYKAKEKGRNCICVYSEEQS